MNIIRKSKMKIKRTKLLRLINKKMITLPWGVYAAPSADIREIDLTHEFIHIEQWKELWYVGFVFLFVFEWLIRQLIYSACWLCRLVACGFKEAPYNRKHGYKNISLEREAYQHDDNLKYLDEREPFAFIKYLWY